MTAEKEVYYQRIPPGSCVGSEVSGSRHTPRTKPIGVRIPVPTYSHRPEVLDQNSGSETKW